MALSLKHEFESAKSDGPDTTLLQPSYWNAEHDFTVGGEKLVGNSSASPGAVGEIGIGAGLSYSGGNLVSSIAAFPIGGYVDFAGVSAPAGWLLMYGQAISRTTYAALFAVLGTTYGAGDATTTFNLPDCRGRVISGKDNMGGVSANRLTGLTNGVNGDNLGDVGGEEAHANTIAEMAAHTHGGVTGSNGAHGHAWRRGTAFGAEGASTGGILLHDNNDSVLVAANLTVTPADTAGDQIGGAAAHTHTIASQGSGTAHNNIQPTLIANKIIYTGVV